MSDKLYSKPPDLENKRTIPLFYGLSIMFTVMLGLPVSQMVSDIIKPGDPGPTVIVIPPPTDMQVVKPPEVVDTDKPKIDDLEEDTPMLTLTEIEVNLLDRIPGNWGRRAAGLLSGLDDQLSGLAYEIGDLTRAPRAIRQISPTYPAEEKNHGIEGHVVLQFVVRTDGTTSDIKVTESSHRAFEEPSVRSVRKWLFEPGEKDGKVVNAYVRIRIPYTIH